MIRIDWLSVRDIAIETARSIALIIGGTICLVVAAIGGAR